MVQSIRQNRAWIAMSVLLSTVLLVSPQAFGKPVTIQFTNTLRVAVSQQAGEVVEVNFVNMNPVPVASVLPPQWCLCGAKRNLWKGEYSGTSMLGFYV